MRGKGETTTTHIDDESRGEESNDFANMLSFFMESADDIDENNIEVETGCMIIP